MKRLLCMLLIAAPMPLHAERWTTLNGTTFDADLKGVWGGAAIFERIDGKRAAIALTQMEAESRIRIQKKNELLETRRAERIARLRSQAEDEVADSMGLGTFGRLFVGKKVDLPPVVPYQPMAESMDLESTVKHLISQGASGHVRAYWDALPTSYQAEIEQIKTDLLAEHSADQWNSHVQLATMLLEIMANKQQFILDFPMFANVPPNAKDSMRQTFGVVTGLLNPLFQQDRLSHESLSKSDLGTLIAQVSDEMHDPLRSLMEMGIGGNVPDLDGLTVRLDDGEHGTVTAPGEPPANWTLVAGRWLPAEVADDWETTKTQMKEQIAAMMTGGEGIAEVSKVLPGLLAAEDQNAFNLAVGKTMLAMGPMVQALGGPPMPVRALPPPGAIAGGRGRTAPGVDSADPAMLNDPSLSGADPAAVDAGAADPTMSGADPASVDAGAADPTLSADPASMNTGADPAAGADPTTTPGPGT